MIQTQTIVDVVDNSGAKSLRCIKVFGGFKKRYGVLGGVIRASIQELRHKSNKKSGFKKGDLVFALVVQVRSKSKRKDGQFFNSFKNQTYFFPAYSSLSYTFCPIQKHIFIFLSYY